MILAAKFIASILCQTNKAWFVQMLSVELNSVTQSPGIVLEQEFGNHA